MKLYLILFLLTGIKAEEWDANNYPNPTAGGFQKCRMRSKANICDPDGVLTEAARYRLDNDLKQLESRTRQENGATFCEKKGITAAMAVARHVRGGSTESVKQMAVEMLRKWTLDSQCQKAIVFVVSTDDMKFWVARDDMVPVFSDEFTELFMQQKKPFQQGDYQTALSNILHRTWEKAISKQGAPIDSRPNGPRPVSPGFGDDGRRPGPGGKSGGSGFKMPSIPGWVWLAIIFGLIPLLCCCLCCYFCCCRGKGGGATASSFDDSNQGGGGRAQGGGRSGFSNLITSMGGAGIGSLIGNMLSGRNRGGGGGGGMFGGQGGGGQSGYGGYGGGSGGYNPTPAYDQGGRGGGDGGRGLYPTTPHKDEGGGGSWG